ncbi:MULTISPECIES: cache domain-containing sensor histidine kinase [Paenibacillus]|uniref:cache domain-containing sensor histidine kinase n=1 Tax=Paenibacillus TaxID=44249 RepID=UPI0022B8D09E|nr:sensor histidine kinase [Paenibacillus caseinilyticus]MCZ8523504.1 sensor histidine kinase [Paenibacillus caseinilyticus]
MRRRIREFSRWSMALKHFFFLFTSTSMLFGILAWTNLRDAENLFRRQVLGDAQIIIERTNLYMDVYLDSVQNILLLLSTRQDLLAEGAEEEAVKVLRQYAEKNGSLYKTMYLVRADGQVLTNAQLNYDIIGNPYLQPLAEKARTSYGLFISEPYDSPLSGRTAAFVLPLAGLDGVFLGTAVVETDLVKLTSSLASVMNSRNQTFAIITGKGAPVHAFDAGLPISSYRLLPYDTGVFPPQLPADFLGKVTELPVGTAELDGPAGRLVAVKSGMNRLGWHFIAFYETSYFYQNILSLYDNYKAAAAVWFVLLFLSSLFLSRYITNPLRTLVAKMDRVRDMEVLPSIAATREDEIGRLARSYNAMMERIHALVLEIKEAERAKRQLTLKMLQSQIAPHFLYNTLACISSLAKQQKAEEVRETVKALVGLLSFSFDKSTEFVTLEEELEGLRMYAYIQQVRYGDKFTLETEALPETLACGMLKLTLQPLVENAIFHGLAPLKRKGRISLRTKKVRGRLVILLRDDGAGMDPEQLQGLFAQRHQAPSRHRFTGIGVMNVQERIRLHYGPAYGLHVFSRPGLGTLIRMELPAEAPPLPAPTASGAP